MTDDSITEDEEDMIDVVWVGALRSIIEGQNPVEIEGAMDMLIEARIAVSETEEHIQLVEDVSAVIRSRERVTTASILDLAIKLIESVALQTLNTPQDDLYDPSPEEACMVTSIAAAGLAMIGADSLVRHRHNAEQEEPEPAE